MTATRRRLTDAKAQRAIAAIVAVIETGELSQHQALLDRTCDVIREAVSR